ncbi:MAG: hypothetical protein Q9P01_16475, partial [Anaerolineae bacterium]|nr:hypothetical protein [Anaerolineae bacterium]
MVIAFDDTTRYWDNSGNNGAGIFIPFNLGSILARLDKVQDVVFSEDANFVLSSESDVGNRPQLWQIDVNNSNLAEDDISPLRLPYPEHLGQVTSVTFSPNGDFIVSTAADGTVFLSDSDGGQLVRRLLAHQASALDAAFSDDGHFILTAGADQVLYLWDVNTTIGNEG